VAVRLNSQSSGTYTSNFSFPSNAAGIEINNSSYLSGSNAMPTNTVTTAMYGMADIKFEPCEYAGLITGLNSITKWDSTILTAVDTIGQIKWQRSNDGMNYIDISGATGASINTGSLGQITWFRTIITNPTCGGDTSNEFQIKVIDPSYPLQAVNPSLTNQNVNWNYNMGYRFTANSNGNVTELGGRWSNGITHTVRLYAYPAGPLLASVNVTGTGDWNYSSISSVALTQGNQYVVAVRLNSQSSGQYGTISLPQTEGQITINNSTYLSGSNSMPTNSVTNNMYGMADIKFEPCVFAGTISTSDSLICSGAASALELTHSEGSIQWQSSTNGIVFTNIAGANDSTYTTPSLATAAYYRAYTSAVCGGDTSEAIQINIIGGGKAGLWTGLVDNNWNNGCNWESGVVPVTGDSIFIPFGTTPPISNPSITISYLELNNTSSFSLANDITVTGAVRLTAGLIQLASNNLILQNSAVFIGGQSTAYIDASGSGEVRKEYSSSGSSITIPVGGNSQFTPITFTLNGSSVPSIGAYVSFRSIDLNHPSIGTPSNRISRYWIIGGANISSLNYNAVCTYANVDIIGSESSIVTRLLNASSVWSSFSNANASNNTLTANGVTEYGDITGGDDLPFQSVQSGNWNNASTWAAGSVPTSTDDATILASHTVSLTGTTSIRSVSINSGGVLNLSGNTLNVSNNIFCYGTTDTTGTIEMNGISTQQITGTTPFNVLRINNSNGVNGVSSAIYIKSRLEVVSGTFHTGNDLTLISTPSNTASIGEVTGSILGSVTAQRNIDGTTTLNWRHLSVPIAGAVLTDIQRNASTNPGAIHMFGFPGSNYPNWSQANIQFHSETSAGLAGNWSAGYSNPSGITDAFSYLNPVSFYTGSSSFPSLDLTVTGNPNVGQVSIDNLSMTGSNSSTGWHFIGNPYPSSVDWSAVSKTGVDAVAYIWNNGGWTASSLYSDEISSFQGIFVHVNNATNNITFNENDKINNDVPYRKSVKKQDRLKLQLTNKDNNNSTLAAIDFNKAATYAFDVNFDAYLMPTGNSYGVPTMGFSYNKTQYQVMTIPYGRQKTTVPITFLPSVAGNFELNILEFPNPETCIQLCDKLTGKTISIQLDSTYSFASSGNADSARFELILDNPMARVSHKDAECYGQINGEVLLGTSDSSNYSLWDTKGLKIPFLITNGNVKSIGIKAGNYQLKKSSSNLCPEVVKWINILEPAEIQPQFNSVEVELNSKKIQFLNTSNAAKNFSWSFGDGTNSTETSPTHTYQRSGNYYVTLKAFNNACSDSTTELVMVGPGPTSLSNSSNKESKLYVLENNLILENRIPLSNVRINLLDVGGKLIHSTEIDYLNPGNHHVISRITKGHSIVIVQLQSNEWNTNKKVIR
jgi:hypothetical protein